MKVDKAEVERLNVAIIEREIEIARLRAQVAQLHAACAPDEVNEVETPVLGMIPMRRYAAYRNPDTGEDGWAFVAEGDTAQVSISATMYDLLGQPNTVLVSVTTASAPDEVNEAQQ